MDNGASPFGDRAVAPSASSPQAVSPVPASIPSAWFGIEPQLPEYSEAGPEPSVSSLVYRYYRGHFDAAEALSLTARYLAALASAIEARSGETPQRLDPQDESAATAGGDAQPLAGDA
jgi:hypothetical protein